MTTRPFTPTEAVSFGWRATKQNLPVLVPLGVLQLLLSTVEGSFGRMPHGLGVVPHLLAQAAQIALAMGWWRIALRIHDGRPVSLAALGELSPGPYLQYLVATILVGLAIAIGLVLLIVPGVIALVRLALAPLLVIDEGRDAIGAIRRSAELTRGATLELVLLALLLAIVNLLGALAFGVGLLLTMPISVLAVVLAARRLQLRAGVEPRIAPAVAGSPVEVTP